MPDAVGYAATFIADHDSYAVHSRKRAWSRTHPDYPFGRSVDSIHHQVGKDLPNFSLQTKDVQIVVHVEIDPEAAALQLSREQISDAVE